MCSKEDFLTLSGKLTLLAMRVDNLERLIERKLVLSTKGKGHYEFKFQSLIDYVMNAKNYQNDTKFTPYLRRGYMPRAKLLKLAKMPSPQFADNLEAALSTGLIKQVIVSHEGVRTVCLIPADMIFDGESV